MSRAVYRGIYSVLLDDPDFQQLTPIARHVFMTMRLSSECTIACIWFVNRPQLTQRTGYTREKVDAALEELASSPSKKRAWLVKDGEIFWIRNGLKYDPWLRKANAQQREGVMHVLRGLPKSPLIRQYCRYYGLPFPLDSHANSLGDSHGDSHANSLPPKAMTMGMPPPIPNPNPIPNPIPKPKETEPRYDPPPVDNPSPREYPASGRSAHALDENETTDQPTSGTTKLISEIIAGAPIAKGSFQTAAAKVAALRAKEGKA